MKSRFTGFNALFLCFPKKLTNKLSNRQFRPPTPQNLLNPFSVYFLRKRRLTKFCGFGPSFFTHLPKPTKTAKFSKFSGGGVGLPNWRWLNVLNSGVGVGTRYWWWLTLTTHTPLIKGVDCPKPLFCSVFWGPHPLIKGGELPPP